MIGLGNNVHLFAQPNRRGELARCFEALGCDVRSIDHPGMTEPMLLVQFPRGGNLSIEFGDDALDAEEPLLAMWVELRAEDPAAVMRAAEDAGLLRVSHPGHEHYFVAPGGQVFAVAAAGG